MLKLQRSLTYNWQNRPQIDRDEDYMRSAKDIALKILQNTVYTMVNDIRTCSQEIISGLKNRIGNLEKQQQPLEILVNE